MTEPVATTWREKQASRPDPIAEAVATFHQDAGGNEYHRMEAAIEAYEAAEKICQKCDEPGCTLQAGIGYPLKDGSGYRRTCHKHCDKEAV